MPTATRTFRVFVSSTFEDLKAERNALQEKVFPELVKLCEEHGARFQAIDLRWGVREEAGLDQKTMEICLTEIARCQKTGITPNFIVLLGDRYGWKPLPARIKKDEFEALLTHVTADEQTLLVFEEGRSATNNGWYRLDWNAAPPEYLLMPRGGEYKERSQWEPVETRIGEILRTAARAAGLAEEALVKYEASATHQEILAGLGEKPRDREHVFAFLRNPDAPKEPELVSLTKMLGRELPEGNVFPFSDGNLSALCQQVNQSLKKVIEAEASGFQSRSALEQEKEAHKAFAQDRCRHFVGRDATRAAINDYLESDDARPLVVHGPSGSGKSAIVARASEDHEGIRRFIGATPEASNGLTLLRSLSEEIGERYGQTGALPATFNELVVLFQNRLRLATADRPLILYVDALNQLGPQDPAALMNWLPREIPLHCRVVLSTIDLPPTLADAQLATVQPFSIEDAESTLKLWFKDAKRTLQKDQRDKLLQHFHPTGSPLYLKLAFEETRLWRSYDPIAKCVLGDGLPGIIDRLFARLSAPTNHGAVLVRHALVFLTAARYGLTEAEMLDVLAANYTVWEDFERAKKHDLPQYMLSEAGKETRQLPVIIWSRLYLDLEPYLTERAVPGGTTISFYHRQLAEMVAMDESHHADLARYFGKQSNWRVPQQANERRVTELLRQQVSARLLDDAVATLTDLDFISSKCAAELVVDLQEDYLITIVALPEAQAELEEERRQQVEIERWTRTLIACAKQKRLPKPDEIPKSVEPWSEEKVKAECKRIIESASRLDRLKAFAGFVERELYPLTEFGKRRGFVIQHAFNNAPSGPVHLSAAQHLDNVGVPLLLRRWAPDAEYDPKPALLRTMEGNRFQFQINGVAMSPDGRRAVSASSDKTLKVWDLETGRELRTLQGHRDFVNGVAISADGARAVSASNDSTLKVWDLEAGRELYALEGHRGSVNGVAISADGARAVSASNDSTLKVWDLEAGRELYALEGHRGSVNGVAISADGARAVSASNDSTLKVWDLETGRELRTLDCNHGYVYGVAISADGARAVSTARFVVSASYPFTLKVWDLDTGHELRTLKDQSTVLVTSVAVSPDGSLAVSASDGNMLSVWNLETGCRVRTLEGHSAQVAGIAVSPDGSRAVSASLDGTLKVWNLETGINLRTREHHSSVVSGVAISADGGRAVSASYDKTLKVWDSDTGRELRTLVGHSASVTGVAVSPDGRLTVSGCYDATLKVWDLETGRELRTLEGHRGEVSGVAVSLNGRHAISASHDQTLKVWNLETGRDLYTLGGNLGKVRRLAVSSDGRRAFSASTGTTNWPPSHHTLMLWDLKRGRGVRTLEAHWLEVFGVAMSPDGRRAVTASGDCTKVWDLDNGREMLTFEGQGFGGVAMSPDGRFGSFASHKMLSVLDLGTGECVALMIRVNAGMTAVAWAATINLIVVGTSTGDVLFFDIQGLDFPPEASRYDLKHDAGTNWGNPSLVETSGERDKELFKQLWQEAVT